MQWTLDPGPWALRPGRVDSGVWIPTSLPDGCWTAGPELSRRRDTSPPNIRACGPVTLVTALMGQQGTGRRPSAQVGRARLREVRNLSEAPPEVGSGGPRVCLVPQPSPVKAVRLSG